MRRLQLIVLVVAAVLLPACSAAAPDGAGGRTAAPESGPSASATETDAAPSGQVYPDPLPLTGDLDPVHDPAMVKTPDGTYLLYSTGGQIPIRTSTDGVDFTSAGTVWPKGAPWAESFTSKTDPDVLWAPDISYHSGTYYLYYSASSFGSRTSAIFLATSRTGLSGSWTNRGKVWQTSDRDSYNAIDPNLFVDDTGWWLSFGSFWSGLKLIRIEPKTGLPADQDDEPRALATRGRDVDGAVEAPFVVRRGSYYYLFAAFDACCRGTESTYRTVVGRASRVTGPYRDREGTAMTEGGGTEIMAAHGEIYGPGHPAVLEDGDEWKLIYHYYYDEFNPGASRLAMNALDWVDDWPVAR